MVLNRCGTAEGYRDHQVRAEPPCESCTEAWSATGEARRLEAHRAHGVRRRGDIVEFVGDYWISEGYAPTLRDIMRGCGYGSPSSVAYHVDLLVSEGKLARTPGIPRSIRVVER